MEQMERLNHTNRGKSRASQQLVLVRLDQIDERELRKLLLNSYRLAGGQLPAQRQTMNNSTTSFRSR